MSIYMAFMWTIPLTWVLLLCPGKGEPTLRELVQAAVISLIVFAGAEQLTFPLNLWHRTDTVTVTADHIALYVLPAEFVLGAAALFAYRLTRDRSIGAVLLAAVTTMVMYTGALAVSFLFIERVGVRLFAQTAA